MKVKFVKKVGYKFLKKIKDKNYNYEKDKMKKGKTFKFIEEIRNKIHLKINKLCVKNIIKFILYKGERL